MKFHEKKLVINFIFDTKKKQKQGTDDLLDYIIVYHI